MQTLLIESKPQILYHKKLYFPMQSVLLWFIWHTCFFHIHSWFAWRLGVLISLHLSSINILSHQQNTINRRLKLHGRVWIGTALMTTLYYFKSLNLMQWWLLLHMTTTISLLKSNSMDNWCNTRKITKLNHLLKINFETL